MKQFDLDDVLVIEGETEGTEQEHFAAIQRAINSCHAWRLQGSFGRTMMAAIEDGRCMLGLDATSDYWGNRIPSRSEVKEGTKGSRQFVVDNHGEDWAKAMESV